MLVGGYAFAAPGLLKPGPLCGRLMAVSSGDAMFGGLVVFYPRWLGYPLSASFFTFCP